MTGRKIIKTAGMVVLYVLAAIGFLCCLMVADLFCQEIQEIEVNDFSGGMVNSVSNVLMKPNQALILNDFDVDPWGNLVRRRGFRPHYGDSMSSLPGQAIIPYYGFEIDKALLAVRMDSARYANDEVGQNLAGLFLCDDDGDSCGQFVTSGFYLNRRHESYPYNMTSRIINDNVIIAGTGTELTVFDGNKAFPARPYIKGQPRVYSLDGIGDITGVVRYRYIYTNAHCPAASTPSYAIKVTNGKVWVEGMIPAQTGDSLYVYRQFNLKDGWFRVAELYGDSCFLDSVTYDSARQDDSLREGRGSEWEKWPADVTVGMNDVNYDSAAPGGITVVIDSSTETLNYCVNDSSQWDTCAQDEGLQIFYPHASDTATGHITDGGKFYYAWAVVFVDSAGRCSYMTPPTIKRIANVNTAYRTNFYTRQYYATITGIPSTAGWIDSASITKKYLIRACFDYSERYLVDPARPTTNGEAWDFVERGLKKFHIVTELGVTATTYADDVPFWYANDSLDEYCDLGLTYSDARYADDDVVGDVVVWVYTRTPKAGGLIVDAILEDCKDDSAITFQPTAIESYGTRLFSIGDPVNKNAVWYSDFGRPTCWPNDKFINIPSGSGDWFNGLISGGDWLALFRQNSVIGLSGLSFYQYNVENLSNEVGLTAPRALAGGAKAIYWPHTTGVYKLPGSLELPISFPIENSIDSVGQDLNRAWGGFVNGEYWLSVPADTDSVNNRTYIYATTPAPHWKAYDVGIIDGTQYDYETEAADYRTTRYIFMRNNDSLWDWNYADTTLDDTAHIEAVYQSKYFLDEGQGREKIFYIDLKGKGSADSLVITIYDRYGQDTAFCDTFAVSFSENERQRIPVNEIVTNASVKITDLGYGDYTLYGYIWGYVPWDIGRTR